MHEIKNVGGYLSIDLEGNIVKVASRDHIQEKWKPVINDTIEAYKKYFGEKLIAVYIRGSVAKGEAIDHLSDLDTIAIIDSQEEKNETPWAENFNAEMVKKYPFLEKIEILATTPEQAKDPRRAVRIMLKTQSICVFGKDISDSINPIKLGRDASQHFQSLQSEITNTINFFEYHPSKNEEKNLITCSWIMKRILRTGFELVMERERKYTRDLYPCFESFAAHYPEKRDLMYQTLELAINPTSNSVVVLKILRDWLSFMPREIERIFDFK